MTNRMTASAAAAGILALVFAIGRGRSPETAPAPSRGGGPAPARPTASPETTIGRPAAPPGPVDPFLLAVERERARRRPGAARAPGIESSATLRRTVTVEPPHSILRLEAIAPGGAVLGVREMVDGEVLLSFPEGWPEPAARAWLASAGLVPIRRARTANLWRAAVPAGATIEEAVARHAGAEGPVVEPNDIVRIADTPNDPSLGSLWGMAKIQAPLAWDLQKGSAAIVVADIDTGVDYTHPDLAANMWRNPGEIAGNGRDDDGNGFVDDVYGYDFVNTDPDPKDDHNHGTHTAGTIGAVGNNGTGVVGVNWRVSIMALKFLSASGSGSTFDAVECIHYATQMGARLSSNSWGGGGASSSLKTAIEDANARGSLFVAAAGNSNSNNDAAPFYPASYDVPNVIAVAASDSGDNKASFSSYGRTSVDLAAPGVGILSTVRGGGYASFSGTSMATPHAAGALALLFAQAPGMAPPDAKARLLSTVDKTPAWSNLVASGGRLNVFRLVQGISQNQPPVAAASASPTRGSVPLAVAFSAAGSSDPDGTIAAYGWDFGDGSTGTGPSPSHTYTVVGTYTAILAVTDDDGATGAANVKIYAGTSPQDPVPVRIRIAAGPDDADQNDLARKPGTVNATGGSITVGKGREGAFRFAGVAVPPGARISSAKVLVFAYRNRTDSISLRYRAEASDSAAPYAGTAYELSGRAKTSAAVVQSPVPAWVQGDYTATPDLSAVLEEVVGRPGWRSGNALSVHFEDAGSAQARQAKSFEGSAAQAAVLDLAYLPNQPPAVTAAATPSSGDAPLVVQFTADGSDPEGAALSYAWAFGDGGSSTGRNPSHTYAAAGTYTATVTATDPFGASASASVPVRVTDPAATPLVIKVAAGADDASQNDLARRPGTVTVGGSLPVGKGRTGALRFAGVEIPRGSTILSAKVFLAAAKDRSNPIALRYRAEASDSASPYAGAANELASRPKTGAAVVHNPVPAYPAAGYAASPDLSALVQEVVGRPGWASGNALALYLEDAGSAQTRQAKSYEDSAAQAAYLELKFQPPTLSAAGE